MYIVNSRATTKKVTKNKNNLYAKKGEKMKSFKLLKMQKQTARKLEEKNRVKEKGQQ